MPNSILKIKNCFCCSSNDLVKVIDLGRHPFADTFISQNRYYETEPVYPLYCNLCNSCGHLQVGIETDPFTRYVEFDYSYTSDNSKVSRKHWADLVEMVMRKYRDVKYILEIASNDGYLLSLLKNDKVKVRGVDPAAAIVKEAEKKGIESYCGFFGDPILCKEILDKEGHPDVILGSNVLNHSNNISQFLNEIIKQLDKGVFIFEVPYWFSSVKDHLYDNIFHEHVNYFTVKSIVAALRNFPLFIEEIEVTEYLGGSLRVTLRKGDQTNHCSDVNHLIGIEEASNVFSQEFYKEFMLEISIKRSKLLIDLLELKENGEVIIAVGAAAKGNTFLNYHNLDNRIIDYITDASPHKIGKFTPVGRIPVIGDEILKEFEAPNILILPQNISSVLKEKMLTINPKIKFIKDYR